MKSQANHNGEGQSTGRPTKLLKQLQMAEDYHKMKEYYYDRYMNQLRSKMLDLDKKSTTVSSAPARELRQHANHSSSKKSSRSAGPSGQRLTGIKRPVNKPVKIAIPKSKRLTMLEAEQRLTRAGFLQTTDDLTEFRNGVSSAEDLNEYTESFATKQALLQENELGSGKNSKMRPLSKIAEKRENSAAKSRPATKGIPKKQMDTNMNPLGGNRNIPPADIARAAAAALEKRCPRMDLPDLHCLRPDSDNSDGETEMVQDQMRGKRRDEYATHVTYLRKMYQRAQANTAQAKRIIDNRDDDILQHARREQLIYDLANVCDAMSLSTEEETTRSREKKTVNFYNIDSSFYDPAIDVPDISDTEDDSLSDVQEDRVSQWRENSQQNSGTTRLTFNIFTPIEEEPTSPTLPIDQSAFRPSITDQSESQLVISSNSVEPNSDDRQEILAITDGAPATSTKPLNLNLIESEVKTIEAKAMSTYWSNYLKVGKSKFAREDSNL